MSRNDRLCFRSQACLVGLVSILLSLCAFPLGLWAQVSSEINGQVTDSSGGVLSGAEIRLMNVDTGTSRSVHTDSNGNYHFPAVTLGRYNIQVQMAGFKVVSRNGIKIDSEQVARIDFTLQVGDVSETVNVSSDAPLLQSETATLGTSVDSRAVADLPLANAVSGRDPVELLQALPGATNRGIAGTQSVNGGLQGFNDIQLDGISKVEEKAGNSSGAGGIASVDTVQEVKLLTNIYSAEFGRSGGATVLITTKSGTNQFHGSAYEYFRNSHLAARNFFASTPPPLHSNQFGATVGGPIRRNRTFFFSSFEAWYYRTDSTALYTVPTTAQRGGDFSGTLNSQGKPVPIYDPLSTRNDPARPGFTVRDVFPGNIIPTNRFDPVGAKILSFYGMPNHPGLATTQANNFIVTDSIGRQFNQTLQHIDHQINDKHSLSGRFFLQQLDQKQPIVFDNIFNPGANNQHAPNRFGTLSDTYVFSPELVNEARLGINYHVNSFRPQFPGDANGQIGLKGLPSPSLTSPQIGVTGYSSLGNTSNGGTFETVGQLSDTLSYTHGRHQFKFGADFRRYRIDVQSRAGEPGSLSFTGAFTNLSGVAQTGNGIADLLLGEPATASVSIAPGYGYRSIYLAGFVQDDIKVRRGLTLNVGLRYDYETPPVEVGNRMGDLNLNAIEPVTKLPGAVAFAGSGNSRSLVRPFTKGWGPRFGFAWSPDAVKSLVVRGGYGIEYSPLTRLTQTSNPGFTATTTFTSLNNITPAFPLSQGYPYYLTPNSNPGPSVLLGQAATFIDPSNTTPYVQLWSFGIQKQFSGSLLLDVDYVGNKGTHLPFGSAINLDQLPASALNPGTLASAPNPYAGLIPGTLGASTWTVGQAERRFPQYTSVSDAGSTSASSIYHSLQTKLEKRLSGGLYFINSYTYSKMLGNTSGPNIGGIGLGDTTIQDAYNLRAERGPTQLDIRHRFVSMTTYDLPFGKSHHWMDRSGWTNQIFGGWQVNWIITVQTGQPLTVTNPNYTYAGGGSRPNRVCDGGLSSGSNIGRYFNTSCFVDQPSFVFGNSGIGILTGPGLVNLDTSAFKKFALTENISLQFRAEAFNTLNHPNFDAPGTTLDTGSFGVISATRGGNLEPTGGPRMVQFALRLVF